MSSPAPISLPASGGTPRTRPRVHFTADGWINDPYGIVWDGERYHLFHQALPGRVTWAPDCQWGRAEAPDLVRWSARAPALTPQAFERGCWSGSAVPDGDGLRLFYSRIVGDDWSRAAIATATPTGDEWTSGPADVVIANPPDGVRTFRDPYVFRHLDEWVMIVGAGCADGSAAALQYRSLDLRSWTYDGPLCARASDSTEGGVWTGAMWECPQLFPLGDSWALVVSVWDADVLQYVAGALGDYDGRRFVAREWQRLTHGSCAYAMSAFADRDGRRCAMSWLREEPQVDESLTGWAGALSAPAVVTRTDEGRLALAPHPDLWALGEAEPGCSADDGETRLPLAGAAGEVALVPVPGLTIRVVDARGELAVLEFDRARPQLHVHRPGRSSEQLPVSGGRELRLLFDADLLEVFGAGGYGAYRIGVATRPDTTEIVLSAPHPEFTLRRY